jgi:hypothetical protein
VYCSLLNASPPHACQTLPFTGIVAYALIRSPRLPRPQNRLLVIEPSRPRPLSLGNRVCERDLRNGLLAQVPPDGWDSDDDRRTHAPNNDAVEVGRLVDRGPLEVAQGLAVEARVRRHGGCAAGGISGAVIGRCGRRTGVRVCLRKVN